MCIPRVNDTGLLATVEEISSKRPEIVGLAKEGARDTCQRENNIRFFKIDAMLI